MSSAGNDSPSIKAVFDSFNAELKKFLKRQTVDFNQIKVYFYNAITIQQNIQTKNRQFLLLRHYFTAFFGYFRFNLHQVGYKTIITQLLDLKYHPRCWNMLEYQSGQ